MSDTPTMTQAELDDLRAQYRLEAQRAFALAERRRDDEIARLTAEIGRLQARIDELMLEYCPDEMTDEQRAEWARHQRSVSPEDQAAIDAAINQKEKTA